jgi:hypothetical protein
MVRPWAAKLKSTIRIGSNDKKREYEEPEDLVSTRKISKNDKEKLDFIEMPAKNV